MLLRTDFLVGNLVNHNRDPSPLFFVSVASKGLSQSVSLLFATLAGRSISVASKGLKARVGSGPETVGAGQWTAVSGEKNGR